MYGVAGFWELSSIEVWPWFCGLWLAVNGLGSTVLGKFDLSLAMCEFLSIEMEKVMVTV